MVASWHPLRHLHVKFSCRIPKYFEYTWAVMDFKKEVNDSDLKQCMYLLFSVYYRRKGVRHVKNRILFFEI